MGDTFDHQILQEVPSSSDPNNFDFNINLDDSSSKKNKESSQNITSSTSQLKVPQSNPQQSLINNAQTGNSTQEVSYLSQAAHPGMCILTMIFKAISIGTYLLTVLVLDWFYKNKTFPFVIIVLSAAFDFWSVKNLTGRYLVKLRWWSEIQEDGIEKWQFESFDGGIAPNEIDSTFFWVSQIFSGIFWAIILFLNIISLNLFYSTLSTVNLILIGGNFIGYYKCRGAHQKKMKSAISMLGIKMLNEAI